MKTKFKFDPAEAVTHLRARDEILGEMMYRVGVFDLELRS